MEGPSNGQQTPSDPNRWVWLPRLSIPSLMKLKLREYMRRHGCRSAAEALRRMMDRAFADDGL